LISFSDGGTIFSTLFDIETAMLTAIIDDGIVRRDNVAKVAMNPDGIIEFRIGVLSIIVWNNCTIGRPAIIQIKAVQLQYTMGKTMPIRYRVIFFRGLNLRVNKSNERPSAIPRKGLNKPGVFPQMVVGAVSKP